MVSVRRAAFFGFLIWLIPFVVGFAIFPLRESSRPLFESIMPVAVTLSAVVFGVSYFRHVSRRYVFEGLLVGLTWLAIAILIDAPLMLLGGPMQMTVPEYLGDIGLTYAIIPLVTVGLGVALRSADGSRAAAEQEPQDEPASAPDEPDTAPNEPDTAPDEPASTLDAEPGTPPTETPEA